MLSMTGRLSCRRWHACLLLSSRKLAAISCRMGLGAFLEGDTLLRDSLGQAYRLSRRKIRRLCGAQTSPAGENRLHHCGSRLEGLDNIEIT